MDDKAMSKRWFGSRPTCCEVCQEPFVRVFYDACVRLSGRMVWGLVCHTCFLTHGIGLGIGKAQVYSKGQDGLWYRG